jgi:hypothetical protein
VNLGLSKAVSQVFSTKPDTEKKAENNTPPAAEKKTTDYISDTYKFFTKRSEDVPLLNFSKTKTDT